MVKKVLNGLVEKKNAIIARHGGSFSRIFRTALWVFLIATLIALHLTDGFITNYATEHGLAKELNPLKIYFLGIKFEDFLMIKLFTGLFASLIIIALTVMGLEEQYGLGALILLNLIYTLTVLNNAARLR